MNNHITRWKYEDLIDKDLKDEIILMESNPGLALDAFSMDLEFGTGGLRGILGAGTNRMNVYTVRRASFAFAKTLKKGSKIAIAYDSRIKSDLFAKEAARVFANMGIFVYLYNQVSPTPLLSYTVRHLNCDGGIVITASHNPSEYNGYKVYDNEGCQIGPKKAEEILDEIKNIDVFYKHGDELSFEQCLEFGYITYVGQNIIDSFLKVVTNEVFLKEERTLKLVYTPLHGSGYECISQGLDLCGFKNVEYVKEQIKPDGNFPTAKYPNPEVKEALMLGIRDLEASGSDILIATDPDCDRAGVAVLHKDEVKILNGNEIGILLLDYICHIRSELGKLPQDSIAIKTIVTTELAKSICKKYGVQLIEVLTGFKFIGEQIAILEENGREKDFIFAFEESCGYLSGTYVRDKDAVNASLLIADMADYYKKKGMSLYDKLEEIYKEHGYLYTYLGNYEYKGIEGLDKMKSIMKNLRTSSLLTKDYLNNTDHLKADVLEFNIKDKGIAIVRPSGTEPKIKVYYSSQAKDSLKSKNKLSKLVTYFEKMIE